MTKKQFKDYTPRVNGNRSLDEAISEVQREMDVRKRLFDRWVNEGRMSWVDAHDRLERHCTALSALIKYSMSLESASAGSTIPLAVDAEHVDDVGLDTAENLAAA